MREVPLYCDPKGRRALMHIFSAEGRGLCRCWTHSKHERPQGLQLQGYLAHKKTPSPRTPTVVLGGWALSYERGTPVHHAPRRGHFSVPDDLSSSCCINRRVTARGPLANGSISYFLLDIYIPIEQGAVSLTEESACPGAYMYQQCQTEQHLLLLHVASEPCLASGLEQPTYPRSYTALGVLRS